MVHIPVDRVRGRIGGPKRGGKGTWKGGWESCARNLLVA